MQVGSKQHAFAQHLRAYTAPPGLLSSLTSEPSGEAVTTSTVLLINNNSVQVCLTLELLQHFPTGCLRHTVLLLTTLGERKAWAMVTVCTVITPVGTCTCRGTRARTTWCAYRRLGSLKAANTFCQVPKSPLLFRLGLSIN